MRCWVSRRRRMCHSPLGVLKGHTEWRAPVHRIGEMHRIALNSRFIAQLLPCVVLRPRGIKLGVVAEPVVQLGIAFVQPQD